jgi:hypothetical protein
MAASAAALSALLLLGGLALSSPGGRIRGAAVAAAGALVAVVGTGLLYASGRGTGPGR